MLDRNSVRRGCATRRLAGSALAVLGLVGVAAGQTQPGTASPGDPYEVHGELYSGSAPAGWPVGDGWAQGASYLGVLDANGNPAVDGFGVPFRAMRQVDGNWGNQSTLLDMSVFAGGNKNSFLIGPGQSPWEWTTGGGGPQKNDITNAYFHTRVDPVTGDRWVFVAAETRSVNGDSHVDFEFNQAGVDQTGTNSGELVGLGPDGGRTVWDFLVSVDFEQGGGAPVASVRYWDGIEFQFVSLPITVFSATNFVDIAHGAGGSWKHFTDDGVETDTLTHLQLVEAGINLSALGIEVDPCATDATFTVKTRSSASWTSDLKDFAIVRFPLEPPPELYITAPEATCQSTTFDVSVQELTGLADPTFEWYIEGCGSIVGSNLGAKVTVQADATCNCTISLDVITTAGLCQFVETIGVDVAISDPDAPTLSGQPSDATVECDAVPAPDTLTADDNCSTPGVQYGEQTTAGACVGSDTITRTWSSTDDCANTTDHIQVLTVVDTTAPTLSGVPADASVSCDAVPDPAIVTASDNCSDAGVSLDEQTTPGDCLGSAAIVRTWTATDDCGNQTTEAQALTVTDDEAPVLAGVPLDATYECDSLPQPAVVSATDNCSDPAVDFEETTTDGACVGSVTVDRTWTATDDCANTATETQRITLQDTVAPALSGVPADATVECSAIPDPPTVTATDNCSEPTVEMTETVEPGAGAGKGTIRRTWTATDACGNNTSATQMLTVIDTTAPELVGVPADMTAECDAVPEAPVVTATDNCASPPVVFDEQIEAGPCDGQRTIRRTWTATDDCGNEISQTQVITIVDTTPPVLANTPADVTAECDAVPGPADVTASDNCSAPDIELFESTDPGKCVGQSVMTRTWTATDACGNQSSFTQTINIVDTTAPTLSDDPADIDVECDSVPAAKDLSARDNCDPAVPVTRTDDVTPGPCESSYDLLRTWEASDDCGNTVSVTQNVVVQDTTPPTISMGSGTTQFICDGAPLSFLIEGTDNCGEVDISIVNIAWLSGSSKTRVDVKPHPDGSVSIIASGPAVITGTAIADDGCGNAAEEFEFAIVAKLGREACSQGFWKNHYQRWPPTGYSPDDRFVEAFGITDLSSQEIPASFDPTMTLGQAFDASGGTFNQVLVQGTAALLNAAHPSVDFPAKEESMVKATMRAAFAGEITFSEAITFFLIINDAEKECGCPIQ